MRVGELLDMLDGFSEDAEILIAHQPGWPLQESIGDVVGPNDRPHDDNDEDEDRENKYVYIVASGQDYDKSPYAPRWVFDGIN